MKFKIKEVKTGVFGIQGSGKTYMVEHELVKSFKKPFVYLLHPEDFKSCGKNVEIYIPTISVERNGKIVQVMDRNPETLNKVLGHFIEACKKGKYDAFILDEASTFLPKDYRTLQKYPNIIDFIDNHRHYGKQTARGYGTAFIYMARRPQAISTEITETSEYLILFAIDGVNVRDYFKHLHGDFPEKMDQLQKDKHNFIVKELGHSPIIFDRIKQGARNKNGEKRS